MIDLNASGAKFLAGTGGGTSTSDTFIQQTVDLAAEAALGNPADSAYVGGSGSAVALLKAILLQLQNMQVSPPALTVTNTGALATGVFGTVFVANGTGGAITITLPSGPVFGQTIDAVDSSGNAGTNPIHFAGSGGTQINGASTYDFTLNYQSASFRWNGTEWVVV